MRDRWVGFFDKITEYSLYAIIFFIPISSAGIESFFGFAFVGYLIKKILKPDYAFLKSKPIVYLALFLFFSALSMINSGPYFDKSLKALFFKWVEYILIFFIASDTLSNPKRIKKAMVVFMFSALLIGIDGLFQRFTGTDFMRHRVLFNIDARISSISASFNHYNSLGAYLTVLLPLATALMISSPKRKLYKFGLIAETSLLGICLLMTSSRGSWVGFIAALLLMLFLTRKFKKILLLLGLFIMLIIADPGFRERAALAFQPYGDADRLKIWNASIRIIFENPFLGKGLGTYMDHLHKNMPGLQVQYAHNCFLQIWAEIGIFGLISFLLFVGTVLIKGIRVFKITTDYFLLGMICGVFGFINHSFFDTNFYSLQLSTLFWISAGIIMAIVNLGTDRQVIDK